MHRLALGGAAAALFAGVCAAQDPPAKPGFFGKWFGGGDKAAAAAAEPAKPEPPRKPATSRAATDAAAERAREEADFLRRLAVSDRLRELALEKQDDALLQQADRLEEQARDLYTKRTAHLPSARAVARRSPPRGTSAAELVDAYLDTAPAERPRARGKAADDDTPRASAARKQEGRR
jgi:hypothetical protein